MAELLLESLAKEWPLAYVLVVCVALVVIVVKVNRDQDSDCFSRAKVSLPKAKHDEATKKVATVSANVSPADLCAQHLPLLRLQEAEHNKARKQMAPVSAHVSPGDLCAQHLPLLQLREARIAKSERLALGRRGEAKAEEQSMAAEVPRWTARDVRRSRVSQCDQSWGAHTPRRGGANCFIYH
eukprot:TRINITY_DN13755_c0_g2_i1.p1 TRINITY_DN13755_c0_g2~~TRINITY_DN13755_c0_g2_i1.p1  ORF type:complete len:183 (-),score=21.84 TRINITY_DN13755_c0_g2_i1:215-763(-)